MPEETQQAVDWALTQSYEEGGSIFPVTADNPMQLVMKVRDYFNDNSVVYEGFSYDDLVPFLS